MPAGVQLLPHILYTVEPWRGLGLAAASSYNDQLQRPMTILESRLYVADSAGLLVAGMLLCQPAFAAKRFPDLERCGPSMDGRKRFLQRSRRTIPEFSSSRLKD